jgi:hypothetical protein
MQSPSQPASTALPAHSGSSTSARRSEDIVYQAMTIAAILLVLGSVWVF